MPADPIVHLRSVNEKLHALLLQVRQESVGAGTGAADAFVHLLSEVAIAARLSSVFVCCRESVAASEELAKYSRTLQELRQVLPTIQARLLSDRARLEAERVHCSAATAWAETSRRTL